MIDLRHIALMIMVCIPLAACGGLGNDKTATEDDMVMGNPKAKITVVEYASASCHFCAQFNAEVFPAFKAKYIDTGQVRYVFREILTPPKPLAAAAFLTARCAGKDKYFKVLDGVFRSQSEIFTTEDMRAPLVRIAQSVGLSEDAFTACISDEKSLKALNARVERFSNEGKITGTPTFVVNGKKLEGDHTLAKFDAAIAEARAAVR
jgi:protein-disulfide isomerase